MEKKTESSPVKTTSIVMHVNEVKMPCLACESEERAESSVSASNHSFPIGRKKKAPLSPYVSGGRHPK